MFLALFVPYLMLTWELNFKLILTPWLSVNILLVDFIELMENYKRQFFVKKLMMICIYIESLLFLLHRRKVP